jgi:hypothetical protein
MKKQISARHDPGLKKQTLCARNSPRKSQRRPFTFQNNLERRLEEEAREFVQIVFDVTPFGKYQQIFRFATPMSELEAVRLVEKFLSEELTEEYYNRYHDDTYEPKLSYVEFTQRRPQGPIVRGSLLDKTHFSLNKVRLT